MLGYNLPRAYTPSYIQLFDLLQPYDRQIIRDAFGLCNDSFLQLGRQESVDVNIQGAIYLALRLNGREGAFPGMTVSEESTRSFGVAMLQSY